jgi:hypothetical protein
LLLEAVPTLRDGWRRGPATARLREAALGLVDAGLPMIEVGADHLAAVA